MVQEGRRKFAWLSEYVCLAISDTRTTCSLLCIVWTVWSLFETPMCGFSWEAILSGMTRGSQAPTLGRLHSYCPRAESLPDPDRLCSDSNTCTPPHPTRTTVQTLATCVWSEDNCICAVQRSTTVQHRVCLWFKSSWGKRWISVAGDRGGDFEKCLKDESLCKWLHLKILFTCSSCFPFCLRVEAFCIFSDYLSSFINTVIERPRWIIINQEKQLLSSAPGRSLRAQLTSPFKWSSFLHAKVVCVSVSGGSGWKLSSWVILRRIKFYDITEEWER